MSGTAFQNARSQRHVFVKKIDAIHSWGRGNFGLVTGPEAFSLGFRSYAAAPGGVCDARLSVRRTAMG